MPEIRVTTNGGAHETHLEQIHGSIETETEAHRIVERIGWALGEARDAESGESYEHEPTEGFNRKRRSVGDSSIL